MSTVKNKNSNQAIIVAGIGEVLWDIVGRQETLGGAPVNFAFNAAQLGASAYAISAVGDDGRGNRAIKLLQNKSIDVDYVQKTTQQTGYVLADTDDNGIATYRFPDNVAWDNLTLNPAVCQLIEKLDVICFGSLAQRSQTTRETIYHYLTLASNEQEKHQASINTLKVFDLNIRQNFYSRKIIERSLQFANVLKLNDDELVLMQRLFALKGSQEEQLKQLLNDYGLSLIALTRGEKGSMLVTANEVSEHAGFRCQVVDTIGAGDAFTAGVVMGLLKGLSLAQINHQANYIASYVCQQAGAMNDIPKNVISELY
ncbi:MAG: carbohydrate kinase [Gammaproteobacteria bacterium]|nr:MAG: carbohydrate kinase [Gammaproteobacteria bacterium]